MNEFHANFMQNEIKKPLNFLKGLWSHTDLNGGPSDYESDALTN